MSLTSFGLLALGTRLRVLSEAMMATVKAFYDDAGLDFEPRWFPVLRLARQRPGLSLAACAAEIGVSHTAVNALVKPLLDKGLLTAETAPGDARAKALRLTTAGEVLCARMEPAWAALVAALGEALPDGTLAMVEQLEETVADRALPRALKAVLAPARVLEGLKLVPFDRARPDHRSLFAALNIEWLQDYFEVEPVDYAMFGDPEGTILDRGGLIVMAEVGGQVVGTGALIKRGDVYELGKMAVSKAYQGKGVGARIVGYLEDQARRLGQTVLYLVSSTKLPHAVPMYRKLGWVDTDLPMHQHYKRSDISLQKVL